MSPDETQRPNNSPLPIVHVKVMRRTCLRVCRHNRFTGTAWQACAPVCVAIFAGDVGLSAALRERGTSSAPFNQFDKMQQLPEGTRSTTVQPLTVKHMHHLYAPAPARFPPPPRASAEPCARCRHLHRHDMACIDQSTCQELSITGSSCLRQQPSCAGLGSDEPFRIPSGTLKSAHRTPRLRTARGTASWAR